MFERNSKTLKMARVMLAAGLFALVSAPCVAADVYVVYSSKDRELLKQIIDVAPTTVSLKSYNVDLLALADYSGKQKVIAKLKRVDFVVFVNERTRKPFGISFEDDPKSFVVGGPENIDQVIERLSAFADPLPENGERTGHK